MHRKRRGYIVEGTATYQVEGEAEQILPAGSAFHEPAGAIIANFWQRLGFRTDDLCGLLSPQPRPGADSDARLEVIDNQ
jgi:hypothetical protein